MFDVAITGGGPAGLMAAKTCAEQGLRAVLLEKRKSVATITRACCQQLIMDEGYEQETVRVDADRIVFENNGFEVPYAGPGFGVREKYYISPGGRKIKFAYADGRPLAVQFDKGVLQQNLWERCGALGVELVPGATVYNAADSGNNVMIEYMRAGSSHRIAAGTVICADGVNSRTAAALGFNAGRTYLLTSRSMIYELERVTDDMPQAMKSFIGNVYQSQGPVILYPYFGDPARTRMFVAGSTQRLPDAVLAEARTKGYLKTYLEKARIVKKTGCGMRVHTPLAVPHKGNALVIGDAAAFVEVETQGALMCGYRGALAVRDTLAGSPGFERYGAWWRSSFEFNGPDVARVAQGYVLAPVYTDDELDYLFGLVEGETLQGSYSQYNTPRYMWGAILKHKEHIDRERPELSRKIDNNMNISLKNVLSI